jgi:hypothetical protein
MSGYGPQKMKARGTSIVLLALTFAVTMRARYAWGKPGLADFNRLTARRATPFGVGCSYFVIPGHDNVKLSTDFQYFLGRSDGSTVPISPLNSIQPNDEGSQFAWRIQPTAAF